MGKYDIVTWPENLTDDHAGLLAGAQSLLRNYLQGHKKNKCNTDIAMALSAMLSTNPSPNPNKIIEKIAELQKQERHKQRPLIEDKMSVLATILRVIRGKAERQLIREVAYEEGKSAGYQQHGEDIAVSMGLKIDAETKAENAKIELAKMQTELEQQLNNQLNTINTIESQKNEMDRLLTEQQATIENLKTSLIRNEESTKNIREELATTKESYQYLKDEFDKYRQLAEQHANTIEDLSPQLQDSEHIKRKPKNIVKDNSPDSIVVKRRSKRRNKPRTPGSAETNLFNYDPQSTEIKDKIRKILQENTSETMENTIELLVRPHIQYQKERVQLSEKYDELLIINSDFEEKRVAPLQQQFEKEKSEMTMQFEKEKLELMQRIDLLTKGAEKSTKEINAANNTISKANTENKKLADENKKLLVFYDAAAMYFRWFKGTYKSLTADQKPDTNNSMVKFSGLHPNNYQTIQEGLNPDYLVRKAEPEASEKAGLFGKISQAVQGTKVTSNSFWKTINLTMTTPTQAKLLENTAALKDPSENNNNNNQSPSDQAPSIVGNKEPAGDPTIQKQVSQITRRGSFG